MFTIPEVVKLVAIRSVLECAAVRYLAAVSSSVWAGALASNVPPCSFTNVNPLLPMTPAPSIVLFTLVSVRPPLVWKKAS